LLISACNAYAIASSKQAKEMRQKMRRQGKRAGRKRTPWDMQRAKDLREGKGWREIAKHVGVSYQTVRRELREYPAASQA
jgi:DNA invertase Pin-like site-specific DNA recombinase